MRKCVLCHMRINKGADQPAHRRSLISAFVVRCADSIISLGSIAEISRLWLVSGAAQAGLCLAWSETPEDTFSCGAAYLYLTFVHFIKESLRPSSGKDLISWLSACAGFLYSLSIVCVPFQFGVWGPM